MGHGPATSGDGGFSIATPGSLVAGTTINSQLVSTTTPTFMCVTTCASETLCTCRSHVLRARTGGLGSNSSVNYCHPGNPRNLSSLYVGLAGCPMGLCPSKHSNCYTLSARGAGVANDPASLLPACPRRGFLMRTSGGAFNTVDTTPSGLSQFLGCQTATTTPSAAAAGSNAVGHRNSRLTPLTSAFVRAAPLQSPVFDC